MYGMVRPLQRGGWVREDDKKQLMDGTIRIVFLADSHLGFDYPIRPRVERRRRGKDFFANFRRVLDFAAATKPHLVVHGGDLFFRSRVPASIVDRVYADLLRFARHNIPLLLVPGNHERSVLPTSIWLSAPNIHVFDRPRTFFFSASGHNVGVAGFPFYSDARQRFREILDQTGVGQTEAEVKLLCLHQTVEGATVGPADYTFRSGADVIRLADIPSELAIVLAGHIHRRQILSYPASRGTKRVVYAGSIERTSFAEQYEPKGFYEIELGRNAIGRWVPRRMDFRELPTRPMVDIRVEDGIGLSRLRTHLMGKIAQLDPNAIVRISWDGDGAIPAGLTAAFLRSVFPDTMTVELAAGRRP